VSAMTLTIGITVIGKVGQELSATVEVLMFY
jgi:hypothetical protein